MKATISRVESFLNISIKISPDGAELYAKIPSQGSPPAWHGPLHPKEFSQLCFRLNQISNGEIEIEGANDHLTESDTFQETVRRQADAIDELVKRAEKAEAECTGNAEAIQNQRDVIEDLREKLARDDRAELLNRAEKAEAECKSLLEALQAQKDVIEDLRSKIVVS